MVLRASMALSGRSVTIYEKAFSLEEHNTDKAHRCFLQELARVLPPECVPLMVTDAGFKTLGLEQSKNKVGTGYHE